MLEALYPLNVKFESGMNMVMFLRQDDGEARLKTEKLSRFQLFCIINAGVTEERRVAKPALNTGGPELLTGNTMTSEKSSVLPPLSSTLISTMFSVFGFS